MLPDKIAYLAKNQTTYCNCKRQFLLKSNTFNLNCTKNYLIQVMYHVCSKRQFYRNINISSLFRLNSTKMLLSPSNLDHITCPDLLLVIEARRYERTSFSLPVVQPRILLGRDLSMTSSVTNAF